MGSAPQKRAPSGSAQPRQRSGGVRGAYHATSPGIQVSYRNRPAGGARAEARPYAVRKAPWRLGRDRREWQQRLLRKEESQARPHESLQERRLRLALARFYLPQQGGQSSKPHRQAQARATIAFEWPPYSASSCPRLGYPVGGPHPKRRWPEPSISPRRPGVTVKSMPVARRERGDQLQWPLDLGCHCDAANSSERAIASTVRAI